MLVQLPRNLHRTHWNVYVADLFVLGDCIGMRDVLLLLLNSLGLVTSERCSEIRMRGATVMMQVMSLVVGVVGWVFLDCIS